MNRAIAWLCWGACGAIISAISGVGLGWTLLAILGIVVLNTTGDEFYDRRNR